ncbi:MAG: hypothetical protein QW434_01435 [Pyrobaculum sp.]
MKVAEEALKYRSEIKRLFEEVEMAIEQGSKPWSDLRRVVTYMNSRHNRDWLRSAHVAVAWILLEAGLRELGDVRDRALSALKEIAERLAKGEEAEVPVKEISEFVRRAHDVAHRLELIFEDITRNAERYGRTKEEAETIRRTFAVTEVARELAVATVRKLNKLSEATLADKVVAFFYSLAEGTAWSRIVLNALKRGEVYGALARSPTTAYTKYGGERKKTRGKRERLSAIVSRLALWLSERGVDRATMIREGDTVKVVVNGETVAEVETKTIKTGGSIIFYAQGRWVEEEGKTAAKLIAKIKPAKAEDYELRALLATDGNYTAEGKVIAGTTSVLQAVIYKRFGMEVSHTGKGDLTRYGLKPIL